MSTEVTKLAASISTILLEQWDPIGVAGGPQVEDEYDGVAGTIASLLFRGASSDDIATALRQVASETMGLHPEDGPTRRAADLIVARYRAEFEPSGSNR